MPRKSKKVRNEKKLWKVGIYCRLSSDDGDNAESDSIANQKEIIEFFLRKEEDIEVIDYYADDGYSGTTFNRPEFKRMFNALINGDINTVIVKDLSRFGRNYIEVGNYIEQIFPLYNIRFIAINDNVDSYKDPKSVSNVIVPFKNLMNDEYARDISNKVRSVLDNKKANGQFIGSFAPYGYLRNTNDKYKFIIDKEAEKVVKKIFNMILSGKSKKDVVKELNSLGIATPRVYKNDNEKYKCEIKETTKKWDSKKVDSILKNRSYTGDLVQGVRKKVSHKIHKNIRVQDDNWVIIPNHHKPIISKDDFEKVQEILYERCIRVNKNSEYDCLAGHLKCNECGGGFTLKNSKGHEYYYCSSYFRKKGCSSHSCKKEQLENNVIDTINNFRKIVSDVDLKINDILNQKEISYDMEIIKSKIEMTNKKIEKFLILRNSIKDDLKEELITEEEYWEYSSEYSKKIKTLKQELKINEERLEKISFESEDNKQWLNEIKQLQEVKELNKILVDEIIEDVVIYSDKNIKVIFKCEDKYFEALDFINRHSYDIISTS